MDKSNNDAVGSRGFELGVALFVMLLAGLVIQDSLRVGMDWADDGPRAGYFPFYIGCALFISSSWLAILQLLTWKRRNPIFAERKQLVQVAQILIPIVVYVALMFGFGIYISSTLLIAWFMRRHGRHHIAVTAGVALGVPVLCYLVFERWFLVPLPKGQFMGQFISQHVALLGL